MAPKGLPAGFDARAEALRVATGVPGMAIAVVEHGKTTLAKGYGVRRLGQQAAVDADTLFMTGSTGKAFTAAALGVLVDQQRIRWDDRVIDHMPGFAMYDAWVTREITIRDLLVHRSGLGLGAGDLLFWPSTNISRADTVKRLRYIKPATSFRSGYAYDNILYMVAGELIEAVTGQTWETFVAQRLLLPAGMRNSTADDAPFFATENRAQPHARFNGGLRGAGDQQLLDERANIGRNAAPAGGLASSATDMARWVAVQLAQGRFPDQDKRLFSEEVGREMWRPVVVMPVEPLPAPLTVTMPTFCTYALGWGVRDYRGARIVAHGGAVAGFLAMVTLLPEQDTGFVILLNSEDGELLQGLNYELIDHFLGFPAQDWPTSFRDYKADRVNTARKAIETAQAKPAAVGPSLPLEGYAGDFTDPWYGPIAITVHDGGLRIDFKQSPGMVGSLEHWQYETFVARWDDAAIEPAYATFALRAEGSIERMTMKPVSPLCDFSYDYQDLLFTPTSAR